MIFDIVAYIIMEWTMSNESQICRSAYPQEKKKSVAGQFVEVKYGVRNVLLDTQKLNREDYGVDK